MDTQHSITNESELEAVIGAPMEFVKTKIRSQLDEAMREFIKRSPLMFISTIDAQGRVDVSPKGDPEGFVHVDEAGNLLIPERLGNRLTFGFRNILRNGEIGLIFLVPNQRETLRVKGVATLHRDPEVLAQLQANGKPALMYTRVAVTECFMHCGKALIRSRLWQPECWNGSTESIGARQFASLSGGSEESLARTKAALEKSYSEDLY
jgi:PPOX class probable FMN-dependent enzyme